MKSVLFSFMSFIIVFASPFDLYGQEQLKQLKSNSENASSNFTLWQKNSQTAKDNISKIESELIDLDKHRLELQSSQSQLNENKTVVSKKSKEIEKLKTEETALIKKEEAELLLLEETKKKLLSNIEQRKANLNKISEVSLQLNKESGQNQKDDSMLKDGIAQFSKQKTTLQSDLSLWKKKLVESQSLEKKWKKLSDYHNKLNNTYDKLSKEDAK